MDGSSEWAGTLTLAEVSRACPGGVRPFVFIDPTLYGPDSNSYWLVKHVSVMVSNSNGFPLGLYLAQRGFIYTPDNMTSGNGLGIPSNTGGFPNGIIKVGAMDALQSSSSDTAFNSQQGDQAAAIRCPTDGLIVPSLWYLIAIMAGTTNPAPTFMGMKVAYQLIPNGCRP